MAARGNRDRVRKNKAPIMTTTADRPTVTGKPPRVSVTRTFLATLIPLALLIAALLYFVYHVQAQSARQIIEATETAQVHTLREVINADLHSAVSDLMILANHHGLLAYLDGDSSHTEMLARDYLTFSGRKGLYDQIRYLDETGMEVIRINYNKGQPSIVPPEKLQNKGKRYYFKDAFVLDKGEVFVSPLDLNIERGKIEQPLKPMIRLGTPVFDSAGVKRGIVLVNYFGARIIDNISKAYDGIGSALLLNADGFFLKGRAPEEEWGFMYPDGGDKTFFGEFSREWDQLKDTETGLFATENGLFSFAHLYPVSEADKTSSGAREAYEPSQYTLDASDYRWTLVSFVPPEALHAAARRAAHLLAQLYGALLVVSAMGAWFFAKARVATQEAHLAREKLAQRLAASNKELEEFAYVASHDLQEPLRKVMAFGDRLETKFGDALGEQGTDYLKRMRTATQRMQTLINDLLTYSRVTTKARPFEPVDLATVTQEVLSDLETRTSEVGDRVEVLELPTVQADALQMRQLFQNLIGNALKFRRPDEPPVVTISARRLNGQASLSSMGIDSREALELTVQDNGIGFDAKYADRIFGTFQRLHGRSEYEGTGIGLSVCRKIVERHGGRIQARSEPNSGATFVVTLPLDRREESIDVSG